MAEKRTLFEKVWDEHVVSSPPDRLPFFISTCTWSTRSPRRRLLTACALPDAGCASPIAPWPRLTTIFQPNRGALPSPIRSPPSRSRRCKRIARNLEYRCSTWTRPTRASSMSSARTWTHATGHDDRVRRQPYQHAWRIRRAGVRHWHVGSGARAGHAMPATAQAEDHADQRKGRAARRRDRERPGAGHHRTNRH